MKASGRVDEVGMGLRETRSVRLTTYLTYARLVQGTVKVRHVKGPVGIAHVGTLLGGRGSQAGQGDAGGGQVELHGPGSGPAWRAMNAWARTCR